MGELNWLQRYAAAEVVEHATEGRLSRREMMRQLVAICGTPALAALFLAACGGDDSSAASTTTAAAPPSTTAGSTTAAPAPTAAAATAATTAAAPTATVGTATTAPRRGAALSVAADDPAVRHEAVTFAGPAGTLLGELARPAADGKRPGILVIHEIFGLTDHIRDVVRRVAKAGYVALAVDLASRAGGTAKVPNVSGALTQGPVADRIADLDGGLAYLETRSDYNGRLGVIGFCFGGGMTLSYAAAQPKVLAAVPYYGPTPDPASTMASTKAAILAHYGATDARVNAGIPALEAAMAGKTFAKQVHAGAGHAFNNDTGGNYVEAVAVEAWTQTLAWLARYLA